MTAAPPIGRSWRLYGPDHEALRERTRGWVAEHVAPHVDAWEDAAAFPRELFAAAGQAGLLGWKVPAALGGEGPDLLADAVVTEELAACGSGGVAAALGAHKDLGTYYVTRFGTDAQQRRWVRPSTAGEAVGALAVTEPAAGSDVAGIRTRARREHGGDWVLDGEKVFITNGTWADYVVVAAVTDPDAGAHHGTSLFLVEAADRGFSRSRIPTLGWRTSHTAALSFSSVRLPAERILGGDEMIHQGFACIMRNFQWERVAMAIAAVRAAEETLRLLGPASAVGPLAALADEVAAARSLTEQALRLVVHGIDAVPEVSMAKWYACDLDVRVAAAAQLAAGTGHPAAAALDRALRDARVGPIGGGTTEIMLEVIGRGYGL